MASEKSAERNMSSFLPRVRLVLLVLGILYGIAVLLVMTPLIQTQFVTFFDNVQPVADNVPCAVLSTRIVLTGLGTTASSRRGRSHRRSCEERPVYVFVYLPAPPTR